MAQTTAAVLEPRRYTRSDYAALRAFVQRIPLSKIEALYYLDDSPQVIHGLERFLIAMRDDLIERAVAKHPDSAEYLRKARVGGELTEKALKLICEIAEARESTPHSQDPLSMWFRPKVARCLQGAGVQSIGSLCSLINRRGQAWWRPIPRIGEGKARVIVAFLLRHAESTGYVIAPEESSSPAAVATLSPKDPLGAIKAHPTLLGNGENRNRHNCQIHAATDLEAAQTYLMTFDSHSAATRASYGQNLARLLFWCAEIAGKSLTDLKLDDIEAYKAFLADPPELLVGPRTTRGSARWKPFAGQLSASSHKFAFRATKAFLQWLTDVRYLTFNPAAAARAPVDRTLREQFTEKAFPEVLWAKLTSYLVARVESEPDPQFRIITAAILLAGDSGLRREEVANAQRSNMHYRNGVWQLAVLGKGNKWRTVTVSARAANAIKLHWEDRERDFFMDDMNGYLITPIHHAGTTHSQAREEGAPYRPIDLARAVARAQARIANDKKAGFSSQEQEVLTSRTFHALRHTLATHAIAKGVSLKTLQNLLGHSRLTTTSVYLQLEQQKMNEEMAAFYAGASSESR